MQPTTSLGVAELTNDELVAVAGGSDACWCSGLASKLGYAIGFALGVGAYLMFSKLLSLSLPMGPLERLL